MRQITIALTVALLASSAFAQQGPQGSTPPGTTPPKKDKKEKIIGSTVPLPVTTTGSIGIVVEYINPFRFQYSVQTTSTNVSAPALPVALGVNPTTAGGANPGINPAPPAPPPPPPAPPPPPPPPPPPDLSTQWTNIGVDLGTTRQNIFNLQKALETVSSGAAAEQSCYKVRLQYFSTWRLDETHKNDLKTFATANGTPILSGKPLSLGVPTTSCAVDGDDKWPLDSYTTAESSLNKLQMDMAAMTFDPGFAAWYAVAGQEKAYDAATTAIATLATQLQSYAVGSTAATAYAAIVAYNAGERALLTSIANATDDSPFMFSVNVNCNTNWYGRGRTDTINLHYVDTAAATPTDTPVQISTSTCLTPATVSTGVGMSFLHNTEYNFVSGISPTTPGTTISVIGTTTDQAITPVYVAQYNIGLLDSHKGFGMQAAIAAGLGSSAGTANVEPMAGLSFSMMHRAFFVSPMLQMGLRQALLPGYSIGFPSGNGLTAIPTVTSWKPGFALTFTFAVSQ